MSGKEVVSTAPLIPTWVVSNKACEHLIGADTSTYLETPIIRLNAMFMHCPGGCSVCHSLYHIDSCATFSIFHAI